MKSSKELLDKAGIIPDLKLAIKTTNEQGKKAVRGTGPHRVKLIADKTIKGMEYETGKEIAMVRYLVEENGEKRVYDVPVKDKKGDLHYLVQRLAEVQEGEEIILEYKRNGMKGYIELIRLQDMNEDAINLDDHENEFGAHGTSEEEDSVV